MTPNKLVTPHGALALPVYLPDATRAVVRGLDSDDLERCAVPGLVMSTFHLMQQPGSSTIKALGGAHRFAGWKRPIITDSGGFQIYSLIRQNSKYGSITDKGAIFRDENGRKYNLTPEKSIQLQMSFGGDVLICLDDPTHVDDPPAEQALSVRRTLAWARRCKSEFERLLQDKDVAPDARPQLFAVVQGGRDEALRRECAQALLDMGFDGFGYGGWPLDADGNLVADMLALLRELIPTQYPLHALGVGHPANIVTGVKLGYGIFDSAMPTRDARHGRLYFLTGEAINAAQAAWFEYVYVEDAKHIKSTRPLFDFPDSPWGGRYTLGYLKHLFDIKDTLAYRLATLHNLTFMQYLMAKLAS
ncbi:MAG: tRNA-ribosyltransferase family protein [Anaerolineales bacterium]